MTASRTTRELSAALAEIIWELGARGLDGVCCAGLSLVEHRTLGRLATASFCAVQDLGAEAGLTKSGATRLVDRLEKRGLLRREYSDADGRVCCVGLTAAGRGALDEANEAFAVRLEGLLGSLSADQRGQVLAAVPALARAVRRDPGQGCC